MQMHRKHDHIHFDTYVSSFFCDIGSSSMGGGKHICIPTYAPFHHETPPLHALISFRSVSMRGGENVRNVHFLVIFPIHKVGSIVFSSNPSAIRQSKLFMSWVNIDRTSHFETFVLARPGGGGGTATSSN